MHSNKCRRLPSGAVMMPPRAAKLLLQMYLTRGVPHPGKVLQKRQEVPA